MNIGMGIGLPFSLQSAWMVSSLFAASEPGLWYDPSDFSTLFQDSAGTTPVTAVGQPVVKMLDKSGNGWSATFVAGCTLQQDSYGKYYIGSTALEASIGIVSFMSAPVQIVAAWQSDSSASPNRRLLGSPKYGYGYFNTSGAAQFTTLGTKDYQLVPMFGFGASAISSYIVDPTTYDATGYHNGIADAVVTGGSVDSTGTNNAATKIGRDYSAGTALSGRLYGLIIKPTLTAAQRVLCESFMKTRAHIREFAVLGDSTIGFYSTFRAVPDLASGFPTRLVAVAGDNIAGQKTKWEALTSYSLFEAVFIEVGLNDLDPAEAASVMIARLQTLVTSVNARKPVGCKTYVAQITPNRARLITTYGAINGLIAYQKWLDFNDAIAGNGAAPITGADFRITGHIATLNDGAGNLAAAYDSGDGLHENNAGRQVIADVWRAQLVTDGLL